MRGEGRVARLPRRPDSAYLAMSIVDIKAGRPLISGSDTSVSEEVGPFRGFVILKIAFLFCPDKDLHEGAPTWAPG